MSKKKTQEEFEQEVAEKLNNEYVVMDTYINNRTKIKVFHKKCGEYKYVCPNHLLNGHGCKKCGIYKFSQGRIKTQEQFITDVKRVWGDEYTVIGNYVGDKTKIEIQHNVCNTIWSIVPNAFLNHHGCPNCMKGKSRCENKIQEMLNDRKIIYEQQKRFNGLRGVKNGKLSYDFFIPKYNLLIEAQGEQHVTPKEHFGGEKQFERQQEHDKRKREYAKNNGYKLLEIWYYDYNNIDKILDKELEVG